jgi:hypothetical protein
MNVFHCRLTGGDVTDTSLNATIDAWLTASWGDTWATLAASGAELVSYEADVMSTAGLVLRNIGGGVIAVNGDVIEDVTPAAVSGYLMGYTSIPKARGSKYVPGIAETQIQEGEFTAPALVKLATLLAIYLADVSLGSGASLEMGVLSKALGAFISFTGSGLIESLPAYQRRRKQGVGI